MPYKDPEKAREYERERIRNRRGDPEKYRADALERSRRYRANNRDEINARARRVEPDKNLWSRYRLRPEDKVRMLDEQHGCCYLCGEPLPENPQQVHVDHDHNCCRGEISCGYCVLGIACTQCNKGCGMFRDDPDLMIRVAENRRRAMDAAAARLADKPAQAKLFDINQAAGRREESA